VSIRVGKPYRYMLSTLDTVGGEDIGLPMREILAVMQPPDRRAS